VKLFGILFVLFLPAIIFSYSDEDYIQSFAHSFQEGKFDEGLLILEEWELSQPLHRGRILGMKAAVYLSMGAREKSKAFMDECLQNLETESAPDPLLEDVIKMYYKALEETTTGLISTNALIGLCNFEQPTGVKLRYWFGIGQMLAGVLAAPFSLGASTALILSGGAMVIDAAADAIDNKHNWERDLDQRQRINPDFQNNSFLIPLSRTTQELQII
jgi:hypothetical protein